MEQRQPGECGRGEALSDPRCFLFAERKRQVVQSTRSCATRARRSVGMGMCIGDARVSTGLALKLQCEQGRFPVQKLRCVS